MGPNNDNSQNDQGLGGIAIPPPPPPVPGAGQGMQMTAPQAQQQAPVAQSMPQMPTPPQTGNKSVFQEQLKAEIAQMQATLKRIENILEGS